MKTVGIAIAASLALTGCVGTTGASLFTFDAAAVGEENASGSTLEFDSPRGFHVTLTRAKFHIGAVYIDTALPVSGAGNTDCIVPDVENALAYVGEVTNELEVDALDAKPQPFPGRGEAIGDPAIAGEVWLFHGDVNQIEGDTRVLDIAGKAESEGKEYPFEGTITIGRNRLPPVANPAAPSAHPICKERIVTGIPAHFTPTEGGSFALRIHPEGLFTNVDFSHLHQVSKSPLLYEFRDNDNDPASLNLYRGLQAREGVYEFVWQAR